MLHRESTRNVYTEIGGIMPGGIMPGELVLLVVFDPLEGRQRCLAFSLGIRIEF